MFYDFHSFINEISHLDLQDALATTMKKHKALDKVSRLDRKEGAGALQDKISGLLLFLEEGKRSPLLTDNDLLELKPLCQHLISKKQMDPKVLELFS